MTAPTGERTPAGPVTERYGTGGLRSLAGRFGWAGAGELINLVGTAVLFLVLAQQLKPAAYGSLQAVLAIAVIAGPLATFGANWQLIRRAVVSDDGADEIGRALSLALIGTGLAAAALAALALALPWFLPDVSRLSIALVLAAQMPAYWAAELAATAAVARADLRLAAQIRLVVLATRLVALAWFVAGPSTGFDGWAWYFAAGNLAAAVGAHLVLARSLGRRPRFRVPERREYLDGFPYGLGNTTEGVLAASDRPLLKQYGYADATGLYAAGYRLVSLGYVPVMALLRAQDRRFFRQGARGAAASHQAARVMARHALVLTLPVGALLWWLAPQVDVLLSDAWAETTEVIRLLAFLPIIKGFQFSFGNALTAAGNQTTRMVLTGIAAAGNLLGNLWLIPRGSWQAAASTTLVAELALTVGFVVVSARAAGRPSPTPIDLR